MEEKKVDWTRQVKFRLCELGPKNCPNCGLCAFGRWYVKNVMEKEKDAVNA